MTEWLEVHLYNYEVGTLRRIASEDYVFEYSGSWAGADEAVPVSLSLPLGQRSHSGRVVLNFMDNLLPDNPEVRQRWATDVGLDTVEPYFLLLHYGQDVAGAISFRPKGEPETSSRRDMSNSEISDRIRTLQDDDTAWHDDQGPASGQFSLGGAQTKFSLAQHEGQWFETTGSDASTHLFKPHVKGVRDGELIEYLIMRTAYFLGIPTATVGLFDHDGQHSLVVERFDRFVENGVTKRLHQEDLLQALGRPRLRKFETNGGPGIDDIAGVLRRHADEDSRRRYAAMLLFSWLVLSTDAHAKNYSIFVESTGVRLTPMYDASSVIPYLGGNQQLDLQSLLKRAGDSELAVRYGASYLARDVSTFELGRIARTCDMDSSDLLSLIALQLLEISDIMTDVASDMPAHLQTDTVARAVEWMPARVSQASKALGIDFS